MLLLDWNAGLRRVPPLLFPETSKSGVPFLLPAAPCSPGLGDVRFSFQSSWALACPQHDSLFQGTWIVLHT